MEQLEIYNWTAGSLDINASQCGTWDVNINPPITLLINKPYLINPLHVECAIGEWNKDKGEYGVRIYFASGKDVWIGGSAAKDYLLRFSGESRLVVEKFEDRVKAGPPKV